LCIAIQVVERYMARARHFAGRSLEAVTRQGPEFCMLFDQGGAAHLFVPRAGRLDAASALCHGEWQDFPEGTAVRWDVESAVDRCKSGNFGLICSYGNSIIYEGYADQCSGTADFVGQVRFRNGTGNPVKQMRPTIVP